MEKYSDHQFVTKTDQRISPKEIFVRSKVRIDSTGKTVDRDKAWRECVQFFRMLKDTGVIQQ